MKRLLVVRIPHTTTPQQCQEMAEQIRTRVADEFTVLVFGDHVEKTEVEIVYDPHIKNEHISWHQDQDKVRQFMQVDTSSSAFMGGKP